MKKLLWFYRQVKKDVDISKVQSGLKSTKTKVETFIKHTNRQRNFRQITN